MTQPSCRAKAPEDVYMRVLDPAALKRARKIMRWTQREVADACGRTQTTIYLLETGRQRTLKESLAIDLTRILDLNFERVFDDTEDSVLATIASGVDTDGRLSA
jgi:putative transcriptional regulator